MLFNLGIQKPTVLRALASNQGVINLLFRRVCGPRKVLRSLYVLQLWARRRLRLIHNDEILWILLGESIFFGALGFRVEGSGFLGFRVLFQFCGSGG